MRRDHGRLIGKLDRRVMRRWRIIGGDQRFAEKIETVELMVDFNTGYVSAAELGGYLDGIRRFAYFEDFLFGNARDAD